jgi:hypothetical protein
MDQEQYQEIVKFLENQEMPEWTCTDAQKKRFKALSKMYLLERNKLHIILKPGQTPIPVIRKGEAEKYLYLFHNDPTAGHFGTQKMFDKMKRTCYWPGMYNEIKKYVESCHKCQTQAPHRKNNPTFRIEPIGPWQ